MKQGSTGNDDNSGDEGHDARESLSVPEAARRLRKSPDAIRAALRRGTLAGYRGNDGDWRVLASGLPEADLDDSETAALRQELDRTWAALEQAQADLDRAKAEVVALRQETAELRVALAKTEAERETARAVAVADVEATKRVAEAEIAAQKAVAQAQEVALRELVGEFKAQLEAARRPWWRRLGF
jgi:hypothetical protein